MNKQVKRIRYAGIDKVIANAKRTPPGEFMHIMNQTSVEAEWSRRKLRSAIELPTGDLLFFHTEFGEDTASQYALAHFLNGTLVSVPGTLTWTPEYEDVERPENAEG